jgi:hypothetical protein
MDMNHGGVPHNQSAGVSPLPGRTQAQADFDDAHTDAPAQCLWHDEPKVTGARSITEQRQAAQEMRMVRVDRSS